MSEERKKILNRINMLIEERKKELLERFDSEGIIDEETEYDKKRIFENIEYFAITE